METKHRHPFQAPERRRMAAAVLAGSALLASVTAAAARDPLAALRSARIALLPLQGGRYLGSRGVVLQRSFNDCGPAALANLARALGRTPPSLDSLAALARTGPGGTSMGALRDAAASFGLALTPERIPAGARSSPPLPLIAWIDRGHFVVVAGRSARAELTVLDPQLGRYRVSERRFLRRWTGEALFPSTSKRTIDAHASSWIAPAGAVPGGRS